MHAVEQLALLGQTVTEALPLAPGLVGCLWLITLGQEIRQPLHEKSSSKFLYYSFFTLSGLSKSVRVGKAG